MTATLLEPKQPTTDATDADRDQAFQQSPLRSVHTHNFPEILRQLNISLAISTYQAGKLVLLRADGDHLNTHFRGFNKPMGLAIQGDRMAVGTAMEIWEFHNAPALAGRISSASAEHRCDALYLPRSSHVTGNIQIHEMAWADDELWFVNTRFSCLATRSLNQSFVPRWKPSFVSQLAPDDRCHLNGLAIDAGQPHFVTAHGQSDQPQGWREGKAEGGIVIDVQTGQTITRGLAMPHSPRVYNGKLWVLNSGTGGIGTIDSVSGQYQNIIDLPGFTRGLAFCDRFAFVGLSQVRESAYFSGIPIADREERSSGVWVIDTLTGQVVAWVKFEAEVREIFSVEVMPGQRMPDLANDDYPLIGDSFVLPEDVLGDVPDEMKFPVKR